MQCKSKCNQFESVSVVMNDEQTFTITAIAHTFISLPPYP